MSSTSHRPRPASALLAAIVFLFAVLADAAADPATKSFDVPAGEASATLKQFAQQAGQQVVFAARDVKGVRTAAVKGDLPMRAALDLMLADTSLVVGFDEKSGTFAVRKETPAEPKNAPGRPAGDRAASDASRAVELPTFEVMGRKSLNMDIRRTRDDAQPYVTFDRDTIGRSGAITIEDFLNTRVTQNTQAGTLSQSFGSNLGTVSSINLRGLGSGQTLILVNGRRAPARFTSQGTVSQPDLNGIPLTAVERIEMLPATASGIYGGSATGGVINVILRRDYAGVEVKTTYENTFESDVANRRVDLTAGFGLENGRTSVLLAVSHADSNTLSLKDRAFGAGNRARILANNGGNLDSLLRGTFPPQGGTANIRSSTGANLVLDNGTALNSTRTFVPVSYAGVFTDGGAALVANAGRFNIDLSPSNNQGGGGAMGIYDSPRLESASLAIRRQFTSRIEGYLDGSLSENTGRINVGLATEGIYTIPAASPNNPFQQAILAVVPIPNDKQVVFNRTHERKLAAGVVLELSRGWKGNLDYAWAQSYGETRLETGFPAALPIAATVAGTLDVLRDTVRYPIDVASFGPYSTFESLSPPRLTSRIASARLAGPGFELPAGPLTVSGLVEYRRDQTTTGTSLSGTTVTLVPDRAQKIHSAYAEVKIPLVGEAQNMPLINLLELQLAGRRDDYTIEGTANVTNPTATTVPLRAVNKLTSTDPTIALRWSPVKAVVFRGSYGTGFLPPSMNQLIKTPFNANAQFFDPRRGNSVTILPPGQSVSGGNPDLRPERSKSWSGGLIFTPPAISGLRFSVDYTRIEKSDNFATTSIQTTIENEAYLPGRVTRGASLPGDLPGWAGPVTFLDFSTVNLARAEVEAIDAQLDFRLRTAAWGEFDFSAAVTKMLTFRTQVNPLAPVIENVDYGLLAPGGDNSSPLEFRGNAGAAWTKGPWTVHWAARYVDSRLVYTPTANAATIALQTTNQGNGGRVESQVFHDVGAAYRFRAQPGDRATWVRKALAGVDVSVGIKNVFNTAPAFDASTPSIGYYSPYADPRMAAYYVSVRKTF